MDDDCGTCPKCGGELKISPNPKLLYECSDYECDYREFMWVGIPKAGKAKGGWMSKQQEKFINWMITEDHKKPATAKQYAKGVEKIEEVYFSETDDFLNFFACDFAAIPKLEEILQDYLPGGEKEHLFEDHGTARSGLKKYIQYLHWIEKNGQQVIHKQGPVDIVKLLDNNVLQALFLQQIESLFPGYVKKNVPEIGGVILLENKEKKQILCVMLNKREKKAGDMFLEMSKHITQLQALYEKENMTLQGIIITDKGKKRELEDPSKLIPSISVKTYSLSLNLLD